MEYKGHTIEDKKMLHMSSGEILRIPFKNTDNDEDVLNTDMYEEDIENIQLSINRIDASLILAKKKHKNMKVHVELDYNAFEYTGIIFSITYDVEESDKEAQARIEREKSEIDRIEAHKEVLRNKKEEDKQKEKQSAIKDAIKLLIDEGFTVVARNVDWEDNELPPPEGR